MRALCHRSRIEVIRQLLPYMDIAHPAEGPQHLDSTPRGLHSTRLVVHTQHSVTSWDGLSQSRGETHDLGWLLERMDSSGPGGLHAGCQRL
jgi:hypothetical protein